MLLRMLVVTMVISGTRKYLDEEQLHRYRSARRVFTTDSRQPTIDNRQPTTKDVKRVKSEYAVLRVKAASMFILCRRVNRPCR